MIECQKAHFQLDEKITYLNCSYMSPLHTSVEKAGIEGIIQRRRPHAVQPQHFFSNVNLLKEHFARVIGSPYPERVALVPSVSYGMANIANNISLKRGEEILVVEDQFPSNVYPWIEIAKQGDGKLTVIGPNKQGPRGESWNINILESIGPSTKLVAMPNIHWADGTLFDLAEIRKRCDEVEALLVIDGTQSVGALPFDMSEVRPDAIVCAGYKWLMGPYAFGFAYYGEYFDQGVPIENNWINRLNSEDFKGLVNYQDLFQPGAGRYSVGEHSNFTLVPMMLAAMQLINEWTPEAIQGYCKSLVDKYLPEFQKLNIKIEDPRYRANHVLGMAIPDDVSVRVVKEHFEKMNISVSIRGNSIRISPNVYNDDTDMENLIAGLQDLV